MSAEQIWYESGRCGAGTKLKIATFNINGIGARLPALLRWLAESKPDVACLQELKAPQERFPEAAIRAAGYGAIWQGQKSWNGVAILARGSRADGTPRGNCPATPTISTAVISKRPSMASWSAAFTFLMEIRRPVPNSTISCAGSSVWGNMPKRCWQRARQSFWPATTT